MLSYVSGEPEGLDAAVVGLSEALARQIRELHGMYALSRSLESDLHAVDLVRKRQVA